MTPHMEDTRTLHVTLVTDSPVVELGMSEICRRLDRRTDVTSMTVDELAGLTEEQWPDILVVSISITSELVQGLQVKIPDKARLLVLGSDWESCDTRSVVEFGVDGFLGLNDLTVEAFADALQRLDRGEFPMPSSLSRMLLSRRQQPSAGTSTSLTPREHETLEQLVEGLSNKQIARRLGISVHGAKRLVAAVLLKLGAPNRSSAVAVAIRLGMVDGGRALAGPRSSAQPGAGDARLTREPGSP